MQAHVGSAPGSLGASPQRTRAGGSPAPRCACSSMLTASLRSQCSRVTLSPSPARSAALRRCQTLEERTFWAMQTLHHASHASACHNLRPAAGANIEPDVRLSVPATACLSFKPDMGPRTHFHSAAPACRGSWQAPRLPNAMYDLGPRSGGWSPCCR